MLHIRTVCIVCAETCSSQGRSSHDATTLNLGSDIEDGFPLLGKPNQQVKMPLLQAATGFM